MNTTKASIVVMSHLSDAQQLTVSGSGVKALHSINFVKYIILECNGNLTQDIDPDAMYKEFSK